MRFHLMASALLAAAALITQPAAAQENGQDMAEESGDSGPAMIVIHPLFANVFACSQHWEGQLPYPGDALGSDCYVSKLVETPTGGKFPRAFTGDGTANEDWFSWGEPVLAPFDGKVVRVHENTVVNAPGDLGEPPASMIVFQREDGAMVLYAHVADLQVAEGDEVSAGQQVAVVGNNGYGRSPHIHVGAMKGPQPMQIVFDLQAYGALMDDGADD